MRKTALVLQPVPLTDVPPPPPTPTNEALMAAIKEGDGNAFYLLYSRHAELLRGVIARLIPDEDECDDVLREVFERIRDRAEHYTPDKGRVVGWLITLARAWAMERARFRPVPRQQSTEREPNAVFSGLRGWLREAMAWRPA